MKLFGQLIRTALNTALLPIAIASDIVTLGGVALDERSATLQQLEKIRDEAAE